ncbi:MAG: REP-associated tyrosine transposase [Candidatus Brocadiia bacterium]
MKTTDWHHAPVHKLGDAGVYIVTGSTYRKKPVFRGPERLNYLHDMLFSTSKDYGWQLQAWTVFENHYHFIGLCEQNPASLRDLISLLHRETARKCNGWDGEEGRKVWSNYWDTRITSQKSYFSRLKYVHNNPVKHEKADDPLQYRWCSARWFEDNATSAFRRTLDSFKIDRVKVPDNF